MHVSSSVLLFSRGSSRELHRCTGNSSMETVERNSIDRISSFEHFGDHRNHFTVFSLVFLRKFLIEISHWNFSVCRSDRLKILHWNTRRRCSLGKVKTRKRRGSIQIKLASSYKSALLFLDCLQFKVCSSNANVFGEISESLRLSSALKFSD